MPGLTELLIILVIVIVLFGPGRLSRIGGELGSSIANFRKGLNEGAEEKEKKDKDSKPSDLT